MQDKPLIHGRLKYDVFFKKIFHQKHILKAFLNAALASELSSPIVDLSYESTEFIITGPAKLIQKTKHDVIDVFCITEQKQRILVELQKGTDNRSMARFLDYQCRNYSSQFQTGSRYNEVFPCYSICWFFELQPPHKQIKETISLASNCNNTAWNFAWEIIALYPKNIPKSHIKQQQVNQLEEWLLLDVVQDMDEARAMHGLLRTEEVKEAFSQMDLSDLSEEQIRRIIFEEQYAENVDLYEEKMCERERKNNLEIAKKLLSQEIAVEVVARSTGLDRKELDHIMQSLGK
ncbi:Rpn family recombination-promoting nuclease/putative transposase [Desulfobulbus sp. TB]|nr:Rpn family recombination-promoting nuclease/putative transposase [Desulfobulbus sp. TB]